MRQNIKLVIIALVIVAILASVASYIALAPHYETIDVNGYKMEVPASDVNVTCVSDNYKIYEDKKANITIRSYAINNANDTNYTGALLIKEEMNSTGTQNCTYDNVTLVNNSGKYSYFDNSTYQVILITGTNLDGITHMVKSLNRTEVVPSANSTINLTSIFDNSTDENDTAVTTTTKKTTGKKAASSNTKSSGSSKSRYKNDEEYDVVIPGTGGKTTKARWVGQTEYGNRYEEVGTGKAIYV
ncbi:MAG: hypothetical protein Q4Q22_03395 [Methanosphaera sp.]|nr:hypothetical protein [Methanosphaera sp.]